MYRIEQSFCRSYNFSQSDDFVHLKTWSRTSSADLAGIPPPVVKQDRIVKPRESTAFGWRGVERKQIGKDFGRR